jgi:hypothetical protein
MSCRTLIRKFLIASYKDSLVQRFGVKFEKVELGQVESAMNHYATHWIEDWCQDNGWTDWFFESSRYWGFPPNAVMPVPIPKQALRSIKAQRGMCFEERVWCIVAVSSALLAIVTGYLTSSPMPLLAAFAVCAVITARMEEGTV